MDEMKQRFVNAVSHALAAAPAGSAKAEVIEELSENLYRRYLDMTAAGMPEGDAFEGALDELGDVTEVIDYLKSLAPDEDLPELTLYPDQTRSVLKEAEDIIREAMRQARESLEEAKKTFEPHKTILHSDDGSFEVHGNGFDDDHGEHPFGEEHEEEDIIYGFGYDKAKGGFFTQWGRWTGDRKDADGNIYIDLEDAGIPAEGLVGIDIRTVSGDVTLYLSDEDAHIRLEDFDGLEIKRRDDNVLSIRPENTASSNFFFGRGIFSTDVELTLPRRLWKFIRITTVSGDVELPEGLQAEELTVSTTSGNLNCDCEICGKLSFQTISGDCSAEGLTGDAILQSTSGDITLRGHLDRLRVRTVSGDVEVDGSFTDGQLTSVSGDLRLETGILPERLFLNTRSGDCSVRLPDTEGFILRYKTGVGDFRSAFPMKRTSTGAIYLDGGSRTYTIQTSSGDIRLQKY